MITFLVISVLFVFSIICNIQNALNDKKIMAQVKKEMAERSEDYRRMTQRRDAPQRLAVAQIYSALQK